MKINYIDLRISSTCINNNVSHLVHDIIVILKNYLTYDTNKIFSVYIKKINNYRINVF